MFTPSAISGHFEFVLPYSLLPDTGASPRLLLIAVVDWQGELWLFDHLFRPHDAIFRLHGHLSFVSRFFGSVPSAASVFF